MLYPPALILARLCPWCLPSHRNASASLSWSNLAISSCSFSLATSSGVFASAFFSVNPAPLQVTTAISSPDKPTAFDTRDHTIVQQFTVYTCTVMPAAFTTHSTSAWAASPPQLAQGFIGISPVASIWVRMPATTEATSQKYTARRHR